MMAGTALAVAVSGWSMDALCAPAPEASASPDKAITEIIVTARRREESLQLVPLAVSAFSRTLLEYKQAVSLADLQGAVPNMNLVQGRGSTSGANIYIRGIGQPDALHSFDPGIGIYLDGVYISRVQGALFKLHDVERVEVLRGPQGTLYGKNTIGGAIKIVSRAPDMEDPTGNAELTIGRFNRIDAKAYVSAPIIADKLAFSLSGLSSNRDGIVTDPVTGEKYNNENSDIIHGMLKAAPSDALTLTLSADYMRQDSALTLGRAEAALKNSNGVIIRPAPLPGVDFDYTGRSSWNRGNGQTLDHGGLSLTVDGKLSDRLSLNSITAYRALQSRLYMDVDATELRIGDIYTGLDQHQFSQEFQLKYAGDRLDGVFGVYYMHERNRSHQISHASDYLNYLGIPGEVISLTDDDLDTKSHAIFGQASYRLTDALSITGGLRYSRDSKRYHYEIVTTVSPSPLQFLGRSFHFDRSDSWGALTPSLTVDYKWSNDMMTYASVSRGYKSGGINGRAIMPGEDVPYAPEYVWSYEAGVKSTLAGGRLRFNGDLFYNDYTDFQARVGEVFPGKTIVPVFRFPVINAAKLETYGAEIEMIATPIDRLNLYATVGYLKADYKKFSDGFGDRSDDHPAFSPKWTMRYGADYSFALGDVGSLTATATALYKSKHWLSVDNRDVLTQDGYWLFNARLRFDAARGGWHVAVGMKNIGGKVYKIDAQEFSSVANMQTAYYGDPRTWSLTAGVYF